MAWTDKADARARAHKQYNSKVCDLILSPMPIAERRRMDQALRRDYETELRRIDTEEYEYE